MVKAGSYEKKKKKNINTHAHNNKLVGMII